VVAKLSSSRRRDDTVLTQPLPLAALELSREACDAHGLMDTTVVGAAAPPPPLVPPPTAAAAPRADSALSSSSLVRAAAPRLCLRPAPASCGYARRRRDAPRVVLRQHAARSGS
jgi:hypothetical protein